MKKSNIVIRTSEELKNAIESKVSLEGADLSNSEFTGVNLNEVNLNFANLSHSVFKDCTFVDGTAEDCDMKGTNFVDCDITGLKTLCSKYHKTKLVNVTDGSKVWNKDCMSIIDSYSFY